MLTSAMELPRSIPFTVSEIDRASLRRRDEAWLAEARKATSTRLIVVRSSAQLLIFEGPRLGHLAPDVMPSEAEVTFLGLDSEGAAVFALDADSHEGLALDGLAFEELRTIGPVVPAEEAALGAHAVAMVGWHRRHRFCGCCGAQTVVEEAGHSRRCLACGTQHFPRTDPAVIMLVAAGDRCVLGKRPGSKWWTVLAGFVEPGETLEAAVAREVKEEVGLQVKEVRYVGSQPWPFPANIMLGFEAEAEYAELVVDEELDDARWFTREELKEQLDSGIIASPSPISIAHHLIRAWLRS